MLEAEAWQSVFEVRGEEAYQRGYGSGVAVIIDGQTVLATADHLTNGEPEEYLSIRAPFSTGTDWEFRPFERLSKRVDELDVALFALPDGLVYFPTEPLPINSDGVGFSQDTYLLGHPYGIRLQLGRDNPELQLPLAKRGILAGSKWIDDVRYFFVDCIANPGFSGGPALFKHNESGRWHVLGIVKGQFVQETPEGDLEGEAQRPAGITAVTDLQFAVEYLRGRGAFRVSDSA